MRTTMIILLMVCSLFSSLYAQDPADDLAKIKQKLLYEGKISSSKKELLSLYAKEQNKGDKKLLNEISSLLGEYTNTSYRTLFKMCKTTGMDCSYYKARVLELQGNAGSAMELYLGEGYYDDYIRLKAYSGEDLDTLTRKYDIKEENVLYYQGLACIAKGEWDNAVSILSNKKLRNNAKAVFYLGYAFLMKGDNEKAKDLLRQPDNLNYFERIEYKRLNALILYAQNKQFEAQNILSGILKDVPQDFLSKRYLAHIYYRTGWFDKAEKAYSELINKEWRDTELYYLLSERCEMRIRNLKFVSAKKDAERIIKEYPQRKDFIADIVSLFVSYGDVSDAEHFASGLSGTGDMYEQGLNTFAKGLIQEFKEGDLAEQDLKGVKKETPPKISCKDYEVKKISEKSFEITIKKNTIEQPLKYYITVESNGGHKVSLPLTFIYDKSKISFGEKGKLWVDRIQRVWSVYGMKLYVDYSDAGNKVNITPWPSSFYLKRVSSHDWSVLTPPPMISHEVGHLLGLEDEYYETDPRLSSRNKGRYIGSKGSIMRNMFNGRPEKRHIHFILSPLECY